MDRSNNPNRQPVELTLFGFAVDFCSRYFILQLFL
jgi:hypothetical protein